jgi:hypothetical protein
MILTAAFAYRKDMDAPRAVVIPCVWMHGEDASLLPSNTVPLLHGNRAFVLLGNPGLLPIVQGCERCKERFL